MPICPECRTHQTKRKDGACPNCGTAVDIHFGEWFRSSKYSPPALIVRHFEELATDALGLEILFEFPTKGSVYQREFGAAERLLAQTGYDLDLTLAALDVMFAEWTPDFMSLQSAFPNWTKYVAVARSRMSKINKVREERKKTAESLGGLYAGTDN